MPRAAANPPRVWGLLGQRTGDNRQVLALGAALGLPFAEKQLRYSWPSHIPNLLRRARPLGVRADPATPVAPPWPDLVLAVGRRSAPLALAIRAASGGRSRLVQIGRPGAPLAWFDLVVTTPQYRLPAAPNVVEIPLPFGSAGSSGAVVSSTAAAPGLLVLVGGPTAELRFAADEAAALAAHALTVAAAAGTTVVAVTSPRTPAVVAATLAARLPAPHVVHVWRPAAANPYAGLLAAATRVVVTADSVSMLADACRSDAAIDVFALPARGGVLRRLGVAAGAALAARAARADLPSRLLSLPLRTGVVPAPRDYAAVRAALARRGLLGPGACPPAARHAAIAAWERDVVARVGALLPCR